MIFNIFKHKDKKISKTYDGRFITDEEISEMIKPKRSSVFQNDVDDVNNMFNELKKLINNGGE